MPWAILHGHKSTKQKWWIKFPKMSYPTQDCVNAESVYERNLRLKREGGGERGSQKRVVHVLKEGN